MVTATSISGCVMLAGKGGSVALCTLHGPILNHASMLIDAAIDGHGIALAQTALAAADLISGRVMRPFPTAARRQPMLGS
jgi:DNA-binding transcriptional LysR family regulator